MKVVAIIQARLGSSRLPGKVLADIHGRPMLKWLLDRVYSVAEIDEVVVATTTNPQDDSLVDWLIMNGVEYFRGSEEDVLSRFYFCAKAYAADLIIRITADDPLKDPGIISEALKIVRDDNTVDYCSNTLHPTFPEGLDIEVFRWRVLERAHIQAVLSSEREHVTPYIWKNKHLFNLQSIEFERNLSHWRWTVDKPSDLEFVRSIYDKFKNQPLVPFLEVIKYLDSNPKILDINALSAVRNEGYLKSISMENYDSKY